MYASSPPPPKLETPQPDASQLHAEIYSQPDCWAKAVQDAPRYASVLPAPGERVAVVGCGTSLYIARAYAFLREEAGQGLTDAWPASEARLHRDYDRIVAITRSGTTTEILDLLDRHCASGGSASENRARVTVITGTAGSPVLAMGDAITLADFDETAVVQTRFATSVLALLRAHLGEDLTPVIAAARSLLAQDPRAALDGVRAAGQIPFVGMGLGAALAEEAALKLRESTQSWVEAYHATEYRHGPMRAADLGLDAGSPRNLTRSIILDGHN
jgi:fructoselysine-6-P-deglycase FrlB-like protein